MTVREIQGYLEEMYGVLVSPDLISQVTDAVMEEVRVHGRVHRIGLAREHVLGERLRLIT